MHSLTSTGQYEDRRNNTAVDCRKTIWIVATNFGDDTISQYYDKHLKDLHEQRRNAANIRVLQASLRHAYRTKFGVRSFAVSTIVLCLRVTGCIYWSH
jgi:ATP-dependent Clp protease ATP-binding subunit ClpA